MLKIIYAKSASKDLKKIAKYNLHKIKSGIEELVIASKKLDKSPNFAPTRCKVWGGVDC